MPRERSEFKPKLTIVETWRLTRGAFGARLPGLKMRVLLLAVEGPPPRLERPKRLVVPVANGTGVTGLRIDRKRGVWGKSVSVSVNSGGRRILKKIKKYNN